MKKLLLFVVILSVNLTAQNYFPLQAGDSLHYFMKHHLVNYYGSWDSYYHYKSVITSQNVNDTIYYKIQTGPYSGSFYYDQTNQKLWTLKNNVPVISVDFNTPAQSWFTGYMGLVSWRPNWWKSSGIKDNTFTASWDTSFTSGSDHFGYSYNYQFKDSIGLISFGEYSGNNYTYNDYQYITDTYTLIEAKGANYSFTFTKPVFTIADLSGTRNINQFPFNIYFTLTHPYKYDHDFIDTLVMYAKVYRNNSLVISQEIVADQWSDHFVLNLTPQQLQVGDIVKLNFLMTDIALFRNRIAVPASGSMEIVVTGFTGIKNEIINNAPPKDFTLFQNYPNPFNPTTLIKYILPERVKVKISVYDILGREITQLVNEEQIAGEHSVLFDGARWTSGVYFFQIKAENFSKTGKMILLK